MKIYISGPMTGYPHMNFPAFHAEAARLRALGHEVVNPAEIDQGPNPTWTSCMKADIKAMMDCDTIVLLPGFEASMGAAIEHNLAHKLGYTARMAGQITEPA